MARVLSILCLASAAWGFRPTRLRMSAESGGPATWQSIVRRLSRPDISIVERQTLTLDLLKQAPDVSDAVRKAVQTQDVDSLVENDPEGQEILAGMRAVRRQIVDDILPDLREKAPELPTKVAQAMRSARTANPPSPPDLVKLQEALNELTPQRLREVLEEAREELGNVFEPIPTNLESPSYEVLARSAAWTTGAAYDGYEVRAYEGYVNAATSLDSVDNVDMEFEPSSEGFNKLAGYIFGGNAANAKIAMTVPVEMSFPEDEMRFPLPKSAVASADLAPSPKVDSGVRVMEQGARILAVRRFPGIATSQEVKRQVDALVEELVTEQVMAEEDALGVKYSVFQYNPPYTLPFLRTNEVAVEIAWPPAGAGGAATEASVGEPTGDTSAVAVAAEYLEVVEEESQAEAEAPAADYLEVLIEETAGGDADTVSPAAEYLDELDETSEVATPATEYLEKLEDDEPALDASKDEDERPGADTGSGI